MLPLERSRRSGPLRIAMGPIPMIPGAIPLAAGLKSVVDRGRWIPNASMVPRLRNLRILLLALYVFVAPQGLSLSFCTAGVQGAWSDLEASADVAYGCSSSGWCSDRCVHDHANDHDHGDEMPEGPIVDLPACPGCQSVVIDDGLADSAGARAPLVDAPDLDPFVRHEPCPPPASSARARSAPPGAVRSTGRLPGTLPLRV